MPKKSSSRKSPASKALIELRSRLGETQQSMSDRLGVSLQTVARWETSASPTGIMLARLQTLAEESQNPDLVEAFRRYLDIWKAETRRRAEDIDGEIARWREIQNLVVELFSEGQKLSAAKNPAGARISELSGRLGGLTREAREWSWRNK